MDEQRKLFLEMTSTPGEDAAKTVKMKRKDLEYYTNLVDKTVAGFERIDFNFERSSNVGKMLLYSLTCYREIIHERRCSKLHCRLILRNGHSHPTLNNHHPDQSAAVNKVRPSTAKRLKLPESSGDGQHFSAINYVSVKVCILIFLGIMLLHTTDYCIV